MKVLQFTITVNACLRLLIPPMSYQVYTRISLCLLISSGYLDPDPFSPKFLHSGANRRMLETNFSAYSSRPIPGESSIKAGKFVSNILRFSLERGNSRRLAYRMNIPTESLGMRERERERETRLLGESVNDYHAYHCRTAI